MRKFKKIGALVLVAVMALSMAMGVSAAEDPVKDVTGTYGDGGKPVYSYSYAWGSMEFTYNGAAEGTWNPETHQFEGEAGEAGWTCKTGANEIKVINHSNAAVKVNLTFDSAKEGISFGFTENGFTIPSAVGTAVDAAPSHTVKAGPTDDCGGLQAGDTGVKLGTITLKVSAA